MRQRTKLTLCITLVLAMFLLGQSVLAQPAPAPASAPSKIYVPYDQLKKILDTEKQAVFLPYGEFNRLWAVAQAAPAAVEGAAMPYLISTARFTGKVGPELAVMQLELTVDILQEGWVEVPVALGEVAIAKAEFVSFPDTKAQPLLRVVDGRYVLLTKGTGRRVLKIEFVRQLVTQPGLNILNFKIPSAAISTLELLIPEENMKVDVEPMLAATTSAADLDATTVPGPTTRDIATTKPSPFASKKATRLQAFLGNADSVKLSWKPKTQAAEELEPVVILDQFQHINVAEALINYEIRFDLDIRRRGLDAFTVQLPADYRVVSVEGANIAKWDLPTTQASQPAGPAGMPQALQVQLFSPVRDKYTLTVKMERFLKDPKVDLPLTPALIQQVLRGTGLIAITHSAARSVEVKAPKNLARVDTGRLPENLRNQPGATAWRFISSDYGATLGIDTIEPRLVAIHNWALGVGTDYLHLRGQLNYDIQRSGLFQLSVKLPEPWEVVTVTPAAVVDDFQMSGKGADRVMNILLKKEMQGPVVIEVTARQPRAALDSPVDFSLPLPDAKNLQQYSGQVVLYLPDQLRAEVAPDKGLQQLIPLPLNQSSDWASMPGLAKAMAFEYKAIDRAKPIGASFKIAIKPTQISADVHRLVSIQQGSLEQEAVVDYRILYAPTDTFYLKVPTVLVDAGAQIVGPDIKEKAVIAEAALPGKTSQTAPAPAATTGPDTGKWTYYRIVLQSPVIGSYTLRVNSRQAFQPAKTGMTTTVQVDPILAAGNISDQNGEIAVAKADTLALLTPTFTGVTAADPSNAADLPYEPHRRVASLAFKYSTPPFTLSLPVLSQAEAAVITTIASAAIVEQVLARDGVLNTHVIYLLSTSRGDRLTVTLPPGAKLYAIMLNGAEAPVEAGASTNDRVVRMPPSAGTVAKIVLEVSYGLDKASASALTAPSLAADLPVQVTLWRLYLPAEDSVLHYDRTFSMLDPGEGNRLISQLGSGQPSGVSFKLPAQGKMLEFLRQGAPGTLSVSTMGKESFSIVIWLLVIAAGVAMLKLRGLARGLVALGVLLLGLIIGLWAPMFIDHAIGAGMAAIGLVALLWIGQWVFIRLPQWRKHTPPPQAATATPPGGTASAQPGSTDQAPSKE